MARKEKKLEKILNRISKRRDFVKNTFDKTSQVSTKKVGKKDCLKAAQDRLEKVIGSLL